MEQKKQFVNFKEINERAAMKAKMEKFIEDSGHCPHFRWNPIDSKTKTAWCYLLNEGCKYCKCPKIKPNDR